MKLALGLGLSAGFGGAAWTPATLTSLRGWYKGDVGFVASTSWADQSGIGNNLTASSLVTVGSTLNGHATVAFATGHHVDKSVFSKGSAGQITIAAVVDVTADAAEQNLYHYGDSGFDDIWTDIDTSAHGVLGTFAGPIATGSTSVLSAYKRLMMTGQAGTGLVWYVNNVSDATGSINTCPVADSLSLDVGLGDVRGGCQMNVAEIVVCNAVLSSTDRGLLDAYLVSRYAL